MAKERKPRIVKRFVCPTRTEELLAALNDEALFELVKTHANDAASEAKSSRAAAAHHKANDFVTGLELLAELDEKITADDSGKFDALLKSLGHAMKTESVAAEAEGTIAPGLKLSGAQAREQKDIAQRADAKADLLTEAYVMTVALCRNLEIPIDRKLASTRFSGFSPD